MACCIALAFVLASSRAAWAWILGRAPAEEVFPPAVTWRSGHAVATTGRDISTVGTHAPAEASIGRQLMATVLAYSALIHVLDAAGLADVTASGGWLLRDATLAGLAIMVLVVGRHRVSTAAGLVGVGALWFLLGLVDMHGFGGLEFRAVPLVFDVAFHMSGLWLAAAAAAVAVVQRRSTAVAFGGAT